MRTFKTIFIRVISAVLIFLIISFLRMPKAYALENYTVDVYSSIGTHFQFYNFDASGYSSTWRIIGDGSAREPLGTRVSIHNSSATLIQGGRYQLSTSIVMTSGSAISSLPLRNDFYIGNYQGTSWNGASNITWNNLDSRDYVGNGYYNLNWGLVQNFTSNISSAGLTFDYYFTQDVIISAIRISRFDLQNTGNSTNDAINNMSNNIVNNQNQNTQNIINNQNANTDKINNTLTDDNIDDAQSNFDSFFNNFGQDSHGLSGVVTAPLDMLRAFTTAQCNPLIFNLPIVHNRVVLPCMRPIYEEYFGIFFSLWQLITTGLISYNVCINLYSKIRALSNPYNDRIEVLNL